MQARPRQSLFLPVLSLGKICKGIEGVAEPAFRQTLTDWLEAGVSNDFVGCLLPIDALAAGRWGRLQATAGTHAARHRWKPAPPPIPLGDTS
ncbi:MAG: hypothetical protein GAK38_02967 [Xylophilus sp.]|nr:MAG: hypothetical protein GAK38_02967 [Xylophilus sp.]